MPTCDSPLPKVQFESPLGVEEVPSQNPLDKNACLFLYPRDNILYLPQKMSSKHSPWIHTLMHLGLGEKHNSCALPSTNAALPHVALCHPRVIQVPRVAANDSFFKPVCYPFNYMPTSNHSPSVCEGIPLDSTHPSSLSLPKRSICVPPSMPIPDCHMSTDLEDKVHSPGQDNVSKPKRVVKSLA
ncbi:hypothetical protein VNO78_02688 [Psophocarpus tetragonolobus]|uniref:Uncharacterized protein n=1 Tax=Psophocarpus tetragonolobus TaxID=3891 RepID=A0AAN9XUX6_PSOTE